MSGLLLDHSSPKALVADLKRHWHGRFRFRYRGGGRYGRRKGSTSPSWRPASASPVAGGVLLGVEFDNGGLVYDFWLDGGWLTYDGTDLAVVAQPDQPQDSGSRNRLDDNLRGVFS